MKNTYELEVRAICPLHKELTDVYQVTVRSESIIKVEDILAFFEPYAEKQIFQEDLAGDAAVSLGAQVEIVGVHSGVTVRSVAP